MRHVRIWFCNLALTAILVLVLTFDAYAASCTVSTTSVNFGNYDFLSAAPCTSTGSITLSCNEETSAKIAIGISTHSGSFSPRMMEHTVLADTLNYNLYTSNSYVQIWGDGNHGTATVNLTKIRSNTPPVIVYGKIFPLQDVSPGRYMEQLVVTISY